MRLEALTLENFRAYGKATRIEFSDLTTIIGKNDIGKSTILEALDIFFNAGCIDIESRDTNVWSSSTQVVLTAEFSDLPGAIILDSGAETSLASEYLTDSLGRLTVQKTYDCSKKTPSCDVYIIANHPTNDEVKNLLEFKEKELQAIIKERKIIAPLKGNPGMRKAIWESCADLQLGQIAIHVSKHKEDGKRIWEQIERYMPMFALFQSDRASKDSDGEVQNPLKGAIQAAIADAKVEIEAIQEKVLKKSIEIATLTHNALQIIDPSLAASLSPSFSPPTPSKWAGLFSVGMDTNENIPLNKRGSGVRRLVLVSFFKAEAERKLTSNNKANIIYAIEEPETSQHPNNQKILIEAFKDLAHTDNCQVILTTHSPGLAAELPVESIRYVSNAGAKLSPQIKSGADVFGDVAQALGVTPDSRVRVFVCVEGPTDIDALKYLSAALHSVDQNIPNLMTDPRCAFVPLGGSTLQHWVNGNLLKGLNRPEVHIYDADVSKYGESVANVNARGDGSWACQTSKHEIESYLHADAIWDAHQVIVNVVDHPDQHNHDVPKAFGIAYAQKKGWGNPMGGDKAKNYLRTAFSKMTAARIAARDPQGEVAGWFMQIAKHL